MIKFNCQNCQEPMEAPSELKGEPLICPKCRQETIVPATADDLAIGKKSGRLLARLWNNSPAAFRAGFLATCGAIAALLTIFFIYQLTQKSSTPPKPSSAIYKYQEFESSLKEIGVFLTFRQSSILRGRNLMENVFRPDANYEDASISLWTNDKNNVIGLSAKGL